MHLNCLSVSVESFIYLLMLVTAKTYDSYIYGGYPCFNRFSLFLYHHSFPSICNLFVQQATRMTLFQMRHTLYCNTLPPTTAPKQVSQEQKYVFKHLKIVIFRPSASILHSAPSPGSGLWYCQLAACLSMSGVTDLWNRIQSSNSSDWLKLK